MSILRMDIVEAENNPAVVGAPGMRSLGDVRLVFGKLGSTPRRWGRKSVGERRNGDALHSECKSRGFESHLPCQEHGPVAQLGECYPVKVEAAGSKPVRSAKKSPM